jgi:hypothetical protein
MLHPMQRARSGRLFLYGLWIAMIASLPALVQTVVETAPSAGTFWYDTWRRQLAWEGAKSFPLSILTDSLWLGRPAEQLVIGYVIATVSLPVAMYLLLMIFQWTMRRVRVRRMHVIRCIVYGADVLVWPVIPLCVLVCAAGFAFAWSEALAWAMIVIFPVVWGVMAWRLGHAYQNYLRFDHPWATIGSVQIILIMIWVMVSLMRWE